MKRKASELEDTLPSADHFTSSDSSTSLHNSSPLRISDGTSTWARISKPHIWKDNYMNSRTRKRTRDNRPDVEIVHQNTLAKLFDAQRSTHPEYVQAVSAPSESQPPQTHDNGQRNLHSFFTIPRSQQLVFQPRVRQPVIQVNHVPCEDCGNVLDSSDIVGKSEHDMMDTDSVEDQFACVNCHRNVCDTCSVRADHRLCLECALPGNGWDMFGEMKCHLRPMIYAFQTATSCLRCESSDHCFTAFRDSIILHLSACSAGIKVGNLYAISNYSKLLEQYGSQSIKDKMRSITSHETLQTNSWQQEFVHSSRHWFIDHDTHHVRKRAIYLWSRGSVNW